MNPYEITNVVDPSASPKIEASGILSHDGHGLITETVVILPNRCIVTAKSTDLERRSQKYSLIYAGQNWLVGVFLMLSPFLTLVWFFSDFLFDSEVIPNALFGFLLIFAIVAGVIHVCRLIKAKRATIHYSISRRYIRKRHLSALLWGAVAASPILIGYYYLGKVDLWALLSARSSGVTSYAFALGGILAAAFLSVSIYLTVMFRTKCYRGNPVKEHFTLKMLPPEILAEIPAFVPGEEKNP